MLVYCYSLSPPLQSLSAYGQTGSGKTFSMTGGPQRYEDRGIIPRAITMLFEEFAQRREATGATYSCYISYLELYNESGYDLLDSRRGGDAASSAVPKVTMLEDEDGNLHFRNLSIHPATSEEEALNLLFLGDTNRAIGETEMNQSSSRSHCIFTVMIECRPAPGSSTGAAEGTLIRSKLNLVDLSGSERVHKTSSTGQTLTEAKYINSSLFFLEMVIVALHERASGRGGNSGGGSSTHVPYRNSMMTSVLRDSLGGNCQTVMIATVSPEAAQVSESISTCQFAQRVALVRNKAEINEELEPAVIIRRLRSEVGRLREEVKYLKGKNGEEEGGDVGDGSDLNEEQISDLERRVEEYVSDRDDRSVLDIGAVTLTRMQFAHTIFKRMLLAGTSSRTCANDANGNATYSLRGSATDSSLREKVSELERTLQRRDHEIAILVDMVKTKNGLPPTASFRQVAHLFSDDQRDESSATDEQEGLPAVGFTGVSAAVEVGPPAKMQQHPKAIVCGVERCVDREIIDEPSTAFDFFRQRYPGTVRLNETKTKLKSKYQEAKDVGQIVQRSKAVINKHSRAVESLRRSRAMDGIASGETFDQERIMEPHPDEQVHRDTVQQEKVVYRDAINRLRELKSQIEYSQKLVEKNRLALQRDFDVWYADMCEDRPPSAAIVGRRNIKHTATADRSESIVASISSEKTSSTSRTISSTILVPVHVGATSLSSRSSPAASRRSLVSGDAEEGVAGVKLSDGVTLDATDTFQLPPGVKLTGNKDVDNDIVAFYKAKAELLGKSRPELID